MKKYLSLTVLLIHFYNPFIWIMYILFNRDIETYYDEKVLLYLGLDKKKEYALCLISYIEKGKSKHNLIFTQYFAKHALKERIVSIMKISNKKRIASFTLVIIALLLFIVVKSVNVQSIEKAVKTPKNHGGSSELITVNIDRTLIFTEECFNQMFGGPEDTHKVLKIPGGGLYDDIYPQHKGTGSIQT